MGERRPGGGMPQTDPILPGQVRSQDNVMMMQLVRMEACVPVGSKITRWPNLSMALGRIGQARRSDRTRSAARPASRIFAILPPFPPLDADPEPCIVRNRVRLGGERKEREHADRRRADPSLER